MIQREEVVKIGNFNKPHGIKGEISFSFTSDAFSETENPFFICELESIFVPFRVENVRFTSDTAALVKLKTINSGEQARLFTNKDVFFDKNQYGDAARTGGASNAPTTWDYFRGFTLIDEKHGEIGKISDVDDTTANVLFVIENVETRRATSLLIPAAEEMITHVDDDGKKIYMLLPDGIFDLNSF
ncbi:ribosome maturation factor RimM [Bacteroidia bacterium]|nr:ribosome maturation factor RimM [Bacteroidia bacterium]